MFAWTQCGKAEGDDKLLTCAKCTRVLYCSKQCQVTDWKDDGHKEDCQGGLRTLDFFLFCCDLRYN